MSSGASGGVLGIGHNLTADREFRYIVQWFTEWSDFQREDFVPIMASYLAKTNSGGPVYVNGIIGGMASVSGQDKPMSLFQCRVKLFNEWSAKWPESNGDKLLERLSEIDPEFAQRIHQELSGEPKIVDHEPTLEYEEDDHPASMGFNSNYPANQTTESTTNATEPIALVIGED